MPTNILGISAFYHDSAAALIRDGEIIAAAQEERFSREKHDSSFPSRAIQSCLEQGGIAAGDLDYIGFYEKPLVSEETSRALRLSAGSSCAMVSLFSSCQASRQHTSSSPRVELVSRRFHLKGPSGGLVVRFLVHRIHEKGRKSE